MDLSNLKLQCGVDTFEAVADIELDEEPTGVRCKGTRPSCAEHGKQWRYKVTIDKYSGEDSGYNLDRVIATIEDITRLFKAAGASELFISRLDIRFDNFTPKSYDHYYKLNQCLLSLVAYDLKIKNRYGSIDPITGELKSICVGKNTNDQQAEYYNKALQKSELGISARLELRSIGEHFDLLHPSAQIKYFADKWFEILGKAANKDVFKALKADINNNIISNYKPQMFSTAAEYLAYNSLHIYDPNQTGTIFKALDSAYQNNTAFYKNRPQQQIITLADIVAYIDILKQSAEGFFQANICS